MSPLYDVIGGAVYTTHKQYVIISGITYEIGRSYVVENGTTKLTYQNVIDLSTAVVTLGSALTYNGSVQTKQVSSVVLDGVTLIAGTDYVVSGNTGTNAGNYTLTITGIGDYEGSISSSWSIAKLSLTKPTVSGSFTYNGSAKTCTVSNMNSTYITQSGTTSAANAGTYTVTFTLKSTTNTQWSDGTTAAVSRTWSIAKATGSISVSPTSMTITGVKGTTKTATITYTGDGAISVASSATSKATVSRSGTTVTVKSVASGSATITITLAEGTNYTGASCTIAITATVIGTLEATDWATIKSVAATGANYWSVGDRKSVAINGTVGEVTLNGTYYVYILGFNHNSSIEGNGIHFQFGFTAASGGVNIAFCDSGYGYDNEPRKGFVWNTTTSSKGGWGQSYLYKTICPQFLAALPTSLRNVITNCTKYQCTTPSSSASAVTSGSFNLWPPAIYEVFGQRNTNVNQGEPTYQNQYAYYANGNSALKYNHLNPTSSCWYWSRSIVGSSYASTQAMVITGASLTSGNYSVLDSYGFAPCFRVA